MCANSLHSSSVVVDQKMQTVNTESETRVGGPNTNVISPHSRQAMLLRCHAEKFKCFLNFVCPRLVEVHIDL